MNEKNEFILENIKLNSELIKMNLTLKERNNLIKDNISHIQIINSEIENFAKTKSYKLAYFIRKFNQEFIKGNYYEKKIFIKWLINKPFKKRNKADINNKSNILFNILKSNKKELKILKEKMLDLKINNNGIIMKKENKTILFFSIISWNYRYQRPQHIAKSFSDDKHSVYYFDADFNSSKVKQLKINSLNIIKCKNSNVKNVRWLNKNEDITKLISQVEDVISNNLIKEAIIFVEFPTWKPVVSYLKKKYGYKIVFDYLDEFEGFASTNNDLKNRINKTSKQLKEESDLIIATSNYLYDKIKKYPNTALIRNGTEVKHFIDVSNQEVKNLRPVIGYIGVIAYWFASDIIIFAANNNPNYDFVLIGDYSTVDISEIKKLPNVKFLGEKNYESLPSYIKEFDVCLIPFDPSLDLIKATNPVKFYEYLSAGKKVVATEIPELEPYRDRFVLLSNDPKTFSNNIRTCVEGTDPLSSKEERIKFAFNNDWKERQLSISKEINDLYPLVSIIIITHNQAAYTKICIDSIIEKTKYPNYEIIIVDNASTDGTKQYLQSLKRVDGIECIYNKINLGYAKSYNMGINASNGQYLVLLNNNTVITEGWLSGLIRNIEIDDKIGMIYPATNSQNKESDINYIDLNDMEKFAKKYTETHFGERFEVNSISMFCVMLKKDIIEEVGFFDESGIERFEDNYIKKLKSSGYKIARCNDVFIHQFLNNL